MPRRRTCSSSTLSSSPRKRRHVAVKRNAVSTPRAEALSQHFVESEHNVLQMKHSAGPMGTVCQHCKAVRWAGEPNGFCCVGGKVVLDAMPETEMLPQNIAQLWENQVFLSNIRAYNNVLALASIGCDVVTRPGFNPTFTIQGKVYHRIGALLPQMGNQPKFAQIFFHDSEHELQNRLAVVDLDPEILSALQSFLRDVNPYVKSFKAAIELLENSDDEIRIVLHADKRMKPSQEHCRKYNLPANSEVAALLPGDSKQNLDVLLHCRDGPLQRINSLHRSYDALHYVLLLPYGTDGHQLKMEKENGGTLTALRFYCYMLQVRSDSRNHLMKSRRLLQQYAADQWAKIELSRLQWVQTHQTTIRAEKYNGLYDALNRDDEIVPGRRIVLPPTITGSPRFYSEAFQNAMAIVRKLGKPDYFITFTTNPKWPEIVAALNPGEHAHDRPDLTCRIFKLKLDNLMHDLCKSNVLGKVIAFTLTIEWQKRGLTHAHILLIMANADKPMTPEKVDAAVSAEIPDKRVNPELHKIIVANNIHGPCGPMNLNSPCMAVSENDGIGKHCTKKFPKAYSNSTHFPKDGYPVYRRRSPENSGYTHDVSTSRNSVSKRVDNSFIVPYNPYLSLRYDAHINVEVVHSVEAVKYLYKYVTKGQDRILFTIEASGETRRTLDEVENFVNARYISASEAFWRIYGFAIHDRHPVVQKLPCHLLGEQTVLFQPDTAHSVLEKGPPSTKLTEYFEVNAKDAAARTILYPDFPSYFTWTGKTWQRRKLGTLDSDGQVKNDTVGRIPTVSLNAHQSEVYHLRMLLHNKAGARSFEDLRTIDGHVCATFQEACLRLGLLSDDGEVNRAMEEGASIRFGAILRQLFVTILIYCRPPDPEKFWGKWKRELARDIMHRLETDQLTPFIQNELLLDIQERLEKDGLNLNDFSLPSPDPEMISVSRLPRIIREEVQYDFERLCDGNSLAYDALNTDQRNAFDYVMDSINNDLGKTFCLNASGGTGKTYVLNVILDTVRSMKKVALATAMSGIAATLLNNGRTLHSRCKVPIKLTEHSTCNVSNNDATAQLLRMAVLLIIDEVSMGHKWVFECLDRSLRDIRQCNKLFGGMTVLLTGDWKQILPVVPRGSRIEIVNACLKMSYIWAEVQPLDLSVNMRVHNPNEGTFVEFLQRVGSGRHVVHDADHPNYFAIDEDFQISNEHELLEFVFHGLNKNFQDGDWLCSRAVICPTNVAVDHINNSMIEQFPGDSVYCRSFDSIDRNEHQYPMEFINGLTPSGMPTHLLCLKKYCPILLLRNMDPQNGHCNGTRYIVLDVQSNVIDAVIAVGKHKGKRLLIPRIPLAPSDSTYPFQMTRRQFPVKLGFAITANKSQGQTLRRVGIYLPTQMFSHGQMYVALSRATARSELKICCPNDERFIAKNIVYSEIL